MVELSEVVDAYWRHHTLASGGRADRLAASDFLWACEAVNEAMQSDDPLPVLDALLESAEADLCFLGAGPVEDLLTVNHGGWDKPLAERCRRSERWRAVLGCVWLDNVERRNVPRLAAFLKPYG